MTREQRFKYEMFVRVRDFGIAHGPLFAEGSTSRHALACVSAAIAEIDEQMKNHVLGGAGCRPVKTATRRALRGQLKILARAARRLRQPEPAASPFRMPRRRTLSAELAAGRAFVEQAAARQGEFERFGLPATFLSDLRAKVNDLQQAADVQLRGRTVRREAMAGLRTALARGLDAARDLDVLITTATGEDPTTFAAWRAARRIEGQAARVVTKAPAESAAAAT